MKRKFYRFLKIFLIFLFLFDAFFLLANAKVEGKINSQRQRQEGRHRKPRKKRKKRHCPPERERENPHYTQRREECLASLVLDEVEEVMEDNDNPLDLYDLLSNDFRETFSKEEFEEAALEAPSVVEIKTVKDPNLSAPDWAEAIVEITLEDGTTQKFLVVLHKENDDWKIFGTEEEDR